MKLRYFSQCVGEIKLLEHASKLYGKILYGCLCEVVDIDKMQYRFASERN